MELTIKAVGKRGEIAVSDLSTHIGFAYDSKFISIDTQTLIGVLDEFYLNIKNLEKELIQSNA